MAKLQQAESASSPPSADVESHLPNETHLRRVNDTLLALIRSPKFHGDDLIAALHEVTEAAANCLAVSRASVWLYDEARTRLRCLDLFLRDSGDHVVVADLLAAEFPRYFRALAEARSISASQAEADDRTSEFAANYLRQTQVVSMLDAAIRLGGEPAGVICLEVTGQARQWTAEDETLAGNLADLVALLLETQQHRHTEAALRGSEQRWRMLFEQSPLACVLFAPDGQLRRTNPAWRNIFDVAEADIATYQLFSDAQLAQSGALDAMRPAFEGVPVNVSVTRYETVREAGQPPSEPRWFTARLFPLLDEQGQVTEVCGMYDDVTADVKSEAAIRASQRRFSTIFYANPNAMSIQRLHDLSYLEVNDRWLEMTGRQRTQVIGQPVEQVEDWVNADRRASAHQQLRTQGNIEGLEVRISRPEKEDFVGLVCARLIELDGESCILGITQDITQRKHAEAAVQETTRKLQAIVEGTHAILFSTDERGRFNYANEAAVRALQSAPTELIGSFYLRYVHPDDRERVHQVYARQLAEGTLSTYLEFRYLTPAGQTGWFSFYVNPLWQGTTVCGLTGVAQDITERKLAEEKIKRFNEELEQQVAQRTAELKAANQELEAFSYSVSHDLRAPLRHIDSFARLLSDDQQTSFSEQGRRYVTIIRESAKRMGTLVDDLLQFSRLGRAEMRCQPVNLSELVYAARKELGPSIAEREVIWKIADLPVIEGDGSLLRQVFVNLLSNALKYSRHRKSAMIEVGMAEENEREITLFVRDNGVGFEMKYVNKLFGVFQRLHSPKEFEGTGIGLANVRRITHRHGGQIRAEGVVNEGATFYLTLPRKQSIT